MLEIESRPPEPDNIDVEERLSAGEEIAEEQCVHRSGARVERRHGAERNRGGRKVGSVKIDTKQLVNASKTSGRSTHSIVCGSQSIKSLVPCCSVRTLIPRRLLPLYLHGGEQGKKFWIMTPMRLRYPKLLAQTGRDFGGENTNTVMAVTNGAPKCKIP